MPEQAPDLSTAQRLVALVNFSGEWLSQGSLIIFGGAAAWLGKFLLEQRKLSLDEKKDRGVVIGAFANANAEASGVIAHAQADVIAAALANMQAMITGYQGDIKSMRDDLKECHEMHSAAKRSNEELEESNKALQKENGVLVEQMKTLQSVVNAYRAEIDLLTARILRLEPSTPG